MLESTVSREEHQKKRKKKNISHLFLTFYYLYTDSSQIYIPTRASSLNYLSIDLYDQLPNQNFYLEVQLTSITHVSKMKP